MARSMKILIGSLIVLGCIGLFSQSSDDPNTSTRSLVSMSLEDYRAYIQHQLPLDRLYMIDNVCYFLVKPNELITLTRSGISFRQQAMDPCPLKPVKATGSIGDYHTYTESVEFMEDLVRRFPDLAQLSSAGQSIEGREIYVLKISDNLLSEEAEPNIFISGCHHAREWISVEIPLLFARFVLENYSSHQQSRDIVDGGQLHIMPIQNPDGLEYSIHTYRMWRKNRRYNGDLSWGVDPNRNYGYQWGYDNIGSSPYPDDAVYRGPYAFSEPETRAVREFLLIHPPSGSLNFHNYSQLILYPWGYTDTPTTDDTEMEEIARRMAELIFQVNGRVYQYGPGAIAIYPTNGDTDDWIYGTFGSPSFTVELPPELFIQGGFFTSQQMIDSAFSEILPAMLYFCQYTIDKYQQ
ncbi:MAG: zinc carboxypeptidase [Candidatus Aminicenantes bacterium]|nr:zinc carboxypeptidase [Candidatus Aminicenantes bacterium]